MGEPVCKKCGAPSVGQDCATCAVMDRRSMKALSVRQPWAWLIVNGYKDIENRNWATGVRGTVLIHASKGMTSSEYWNVHRFVRSLVAEGRAPADALERMPSLYDMQLGGIVGQVDITDCVDRSASPWFFGKHGFVLANAKATEFMPYRGQLGFFEVQQ